MVRKGVQGPQGPGGTEKVNVLDARPALQSVELDEAEDVVTETNPSEKGVLPKKPILIPVNQEFLEQYKQALGVEQQMAQTHSILALSNSDLRDKLKKNEADIDRVTTDRKANNEKAREVFTALENDARLDRGKNYRLALQEGVFIEVQENGQPV